MVATDVVAVPEQHVALVRELVGLAAEVRVRRVLRDDAQRLALTATADPDGRVRLLERLRIALRAAHGEVRALVGRVGLGPHALHDLDAVLEHRDAGAGRRELVAVRLVLALVPTGADAPVEPAAGD